MENIFLEVKVSDELPINSRPVFCFDERGNKRNAFYVSEENKIVCEFGEYDEEMPDYLTSNADTETYYYKIGWYEELENSGIYDYGIYQRNIKFWLKQVPAKDLFNAFLLYAEHITADENTFDSFMEKIKKGEIKI